MKQVNDISEELRKMGSSLADLSREVPYSIPSGYFEHTPISTLDSIKNIEEYEPTPVWGKSNPYSLPEGYFKKLPDILTEAAKTDDFISSMPASSPLSVPQGYFNVLPEQILNIAKTANTPGKEKKTISLKRLHVPIQIRWAAAAILLLGAGFGSYNILFPHTNNPDKILASVPKSDIKDYLQHTYRLDINRVVNNKSINDLALENKDIVQYLNETGWDVTD